LRASFIHHQGASAQLLTVGSGDGCFSSRIVSELNEGKAARLSGIAVANQSDAV
jgi:hypothetical protein